MEFSDLLDQFRSQDAKRQAETHRLNLITQQRERECQEERRRYDERGVCANTILYILTDRCEQEVCMCMCEHNVVHTEKDTLVLLSDKVLFGCVNDS